MKFRYLLILLLALVVACSQETDPVAEAVVEAPYDPAHDYYTFSNYEQFQTRHIALDLDVDFEAEELVGSVILFISRLDPNAREITLDIRDIKIEAASVSEGEGDFITVIYGFDNYFTNRKSQRINGLDLLVNAILLVRIYNELAVDLFPEILVAQAD